MEYLSLTIVPLSTVFRLLLPNLSLIRDLPSPLLAAFVFFDIERIGNKIKETSTTRANDSSPVTSIGQSEMAIYICIEQQISTKTRRILLVKL